MRFLKSLTAGLLLLLIAVPSPAETDRFAPVEIPKKTARQVSREALIKKFINAVALIKTNYVKKAELEPLIEGALKGMLRSLDPFSTYLNRDDLKDLKTKTKGEFAGLGIEVSKKGGKLHVIAPLDDSPAAKAGIQPGDWIVKIDGERTHPLSLSESVKLMRGEKGTEIVLTIAREPELKEEDLTLVRDVITIESIKEFRLLEEQIGYIRIASFAEQTTDDFENAFLDLKSQGMTALVIDLRNNAGGLLNAAINLTNKFLKYREVIVVTKGGVDEIQRNYYSWSHSPLLISPLVLLTNKGTASGSEIFAGAMQDHELGVVVGQQSFGKGSVQSIIPFEDETALRMTTSLYYTPSGRLIHEKGITPDVVVESPKEKKEGEDPVLDRALLMIREYRKKESKTP